MNTPPKERKCVGECPNTCKAHMGEYVYCTNEGCICHKIDSVLEKVDQQVGGALRALGGDIKEPTISVGFLRQYLNESPDWKGKMWTDEDILRFIRIPSQEQGVSCCEKTRQEERRRYIDHGEERFEAGVEAERSRVERIVEGRKIDISKSGEHSMPARAINRAIDDILKALKNN